MRQMRLLVILVISIAAFSPAAKAERPALTAKPNSAGEVVMTWTLPSGHTSTNLHWSKDPSTVATPASDPSEGEQMKCFASGPSDGVHNCTGGHDLGDTQTSYTIKGLAPGTYYAQVMTYGVKKWLDTAYNVWLDVHYYGYSPVVEFTVTAASGGGSGSSGGGSGSGGESGSGGSGGGGASTGSVKATFTSPVTIRRSDGSVAKTSQPATIKPFDEVLARDGVAKMQLKAGALVLARNAVVQLTPSGSASAWKLKSGSVYERGLVLVQVGDVKVQSGSFVATATTAGAVVQCLSGSTNIRRGTGFGTTVATLRPGQQATVPRGGTARVVKVLPPKNPFWR